MLAPTTDNGTTPTQDDLSAVSLPSIAVVPSPDAATNTVDVASNDDNAAPTAYNTAPSIDAAKLASISNTDIVAIPVTSGTTGEDNTEEITEAISTPNPKAGRKRKASSKSQTAVDPNAAPSTATDKPKRKRAGPKAKGESTTNVPRTTKPPKVKAVDVPSIDAPDNFADSAFSNMNIIPAQAINALETDLASSSINAEVTNLLDDKAMVDATSDATSFAESDIVTTTTNEAVLDAIDSAKNEVAVSTTKSKKESKAKSSQRPKASNANVLPNIDAAIPAPSDIAAVPTTTTDTPEVSLPLFSTNTEVSSLVENVAMASTISNAVMDTANLTKNKATASTTKLKAKPKAKTAGKSKVKGEPKTNDTQKARARKTKATGVPKMDATDDFVAPALSNPTINAPETGMSSSPTNVEAISLLEDEAIPSTMNGDVAKKQAKIKYKPGKKADVQMQDMSDIVDLTDDKDAKKTKQPEPSSSVGRRQSARKSREKKERMYGNDDDDDFMMEDVEVDGEPVEAVETQLEDIAQFQHYLERDDSFLATADLRVSKSVLKIGVYHLLIQSSIDAYTSLIDFSSSIGESKISQVTT